MTFLGQRVGERTSGVKQKAAGLKTAGIAGAEEAASLSALAGTLSVGGPFEGGQSVAGQCSQRAAGVERRAGLRGRLLVMPGFGHAEGQQAAERDRVGDGQEDGLETNGFQVDQAADQR